MYTPLNQYHVIMEASPEFWQSPQGLKHIYVRGSNGKLSPLSAFARDQTLTAPLSVNHQGLFPSITISFNLNPGVALGTAVDDINHATTQIGLPATIHGTYSGTAQAFQESLASEPILIAAALATVYIV